MENNENEQDNHSSFSSTSLVSTNVSSATCPPARFKLTPSIPGLAIGARFSAEASSTLRAIQSSVLRS
jgi:hypothetical protein